jgi:hypothetical protein
MLEPERSDSRIISTTDARQGITGQNVRIVLVVSLLLAASAGIALMGWVRMFAPPVGG